MTERSTRRARQVVRDAARSAEANARTGEAVSEVLVRWYHPDFLARLEDRADKLSDRLGDETAERLIGPRPTDTQDGAS